MAKETDSTEIPAFVRSARSRHSERAQRLLGILLWLGLLLILLRFGAS